MERPRAIVDPAIAALRVELLGRFMVSRADLSVPETGWRLGKARSLIKLLALAPGCRLHREQVIDLLWPELDFEDGANNLHQVLHVARRTLAPLAPELQPTRIVRLQQQMLALEGPDGVWVDAVAFERLASEALTAETTAPGYAAVELYHGDLLPEDLYEDWAAEPREALRQQYLAVLLRLAALHEARREATPAIDALRRIVAAEPLREEAHVGLMRLYALTSRRQQAHRQFERLQELLERELDARPEPITIELNTAIQAGRYPAEVWPAAPAPAPRPAAPIVHERVEPFAGRSPDFVDREVELRTLNEALEQALDGAGQVVFIAGEPGIGKTRIIEELARYAHSQQVAIRWGRSYHDAGEPAYWPWVQILREHLRTSAPDEITADFGAEAADLARITPELRRWFPELPEPPRLDPEQERFRLFDSMSTVLTRMADRQPLLLVLDDLHWVDRSSLLLLEYVAGPLTASRLLIVGAYRHVEVDRRHPLIRTLAELSRQGLTRRIDLHGLDEQAVGSFSALTAGRPAPDGLPSVIHEQTSGNPYFVKEIVQLLLDEDRFDQGDEVRSWRIAVPRGIRETMALRRDRLSDNANQVLSIAAVVGRDFGLDVVSAVSARPTIEVLEGLEESLRAGLLTEVAGQPGTFHFVHAIARRTLYDELSQARRVTMHRQIGEAIEQLHAVDLDAVLPELAHHFHAAATLDVGDKAIEYLRRAGQQAEASVAYAEAAEFFEQAVDLAVASPTAQAAETVRLFLDLGRTRQYAGLSDDAISAYRAAYDRASDVDLSLELAEAAIGFADAAYQMHDYDERGRGIPYLETALENLTYERADLRITIIDRLVRARTEAFERADADIQRAKALSDEAVALAERAGDPTAELAAMIARQRILWHSACADERIANASRVVEIAAQTQDHQKLLLGYAWRIHELVELGDLTAAAADNDAYAELADRLRLRHSRWAATFRSAMLAIARGELADGVRLTEEAHDIGRPSAGLGAEEAYFLQMAMIEWERGYSDNTLALGRSLVGQYPSYSYLHAILALAYAASDDPANARKLYEDAARDRFELVPDNLMRPLTLAVYSELCAELNDAQGAAPLYKMLTPYRQANISGGGNVLCLGSGAYFLGRLALTLGNHELAAAHLQEASAYDRERGLMPKTAHALYWLASALAASNCTAKTTEAAHLLTEAQQIASACGLLRIGQRIVSLSKCLSEVS